MKDLWVSFVHYLLVSSLAFALGQLVRPKRVTGSAIDAGIIRGPGSVSHR